MTKTIEQEAMDLINEVFSEREYPGDSCVRRASNSYHEAICRVIEQLRAEREAHAATKAEYEAFRQEVSDAVEHYLDQWRDHTPSREVFTCQFAHFIITKPDPLAQVAREMVLLDGVVRTDNQKAAIREGRAANTAADDFYDRLRAALAARGLKLVEVGDAD